MRVSRKPFRAAAAALFAGLLFSAPLTAGAPAADRLRSAQGSSITIENFGHVSDAYYRGAQPETADYGDLAAIGVRTIVDLTDEPDKGGDARLAGLRFVQIPMSSTSPPSAAQVDEFLRLVNDPAQQPVFVHCKGGKHRTGTLTAIYRMAEHGWSADRAYEEMRQYDFDYGYGHGGQKKFVFAYGENLERTRPASKRPRQ